MAFKDLIDMLHESAAETASRISATDSALTSAGSSYAMNQGGPAAPLAQHMKVPGSPVGKGGRGGRLQAFLAGISDQESGGNYHAVNSGSGALGKYQVMPSNVAGWSKQVLGHSVTPQYYLNHPKVQERIVQGILGGYFKQFGARGAAKAWYAGPDDARTNSNSPQYGGPSINDYAASVLQHMRKHL